ncbi:MAG: antibiotic biosynthesis monooxygenase [Rhodospirillaceae bacterium]|nr:antibiotic biosynthesis monooxygenase [Rhodospirillaceae bacterium]
MPINHAIKPPSGSIAVMFITKLNPEAYGDGYEETSGRMIELVKDQPGFLGAESARGEDGFGITISYWKDEAAVKAWRENPEHAIAMQKGKGWYDVYTTVRTVVS